MEPEHPINMWRTDWVAKIAYFKRNAGYLVQKIVTLLVLLCNTAGNLFPFALFKISILLLFRNTELLLVLSYSFE